LHGLDPATMQCNKNVHMPRAKAAIFLEAIFRSSDCRIYAPCTVVRVALTQQSNIMQSRKEWHTNCTRPLTVVASSPAARRLDVCNKAATSRSGPKIVIICRVMASIVPIRHGLPRGGHKWLTIVHSDGR